MSLRTVRQLLVALSVFACTSVFATPVTFNVSGIPSNGALFDYGNKAFALSIGANASVTSLSYNVNLTANAPSLLADMRVAITDSAFSAGIIVTPGFLDNISGTKTYAALFDLTALGQNFTVGTDGILQLEFFNTTNNLAGAEGQWNTGTITFEVTQSGAPMPEPASVAILGLGLMGMAAARRRRSA